MRCLDLAYVACENKFVFLQWAKHTSKKKRIMESCLQVLFL